MTHNTQVTPEVFEALKATRRHLFVKHNPLFMPDDRLLITQPDSREQLDMAIISIDHGPSSKHVNGHYSLLGLYAQYQPLTAPTQATDI